MSCFRLVFSQSLLSLNIIEYFLEQIDSVLTRETENKADDEVGYIAFNVCLLICVDVVAAGSTRHHVTLCPVLVPVFV